MALFIDPDVSEDDDDNVVKRMRAKENNIAKEKREREEAIQAKNQAEKDRVAGILAKKLESENKKGRPDAIDTKKLAEKTAAEKKKMELEKKLAEKKLKEAEKERSKKLKEIMKQHKGRDRRATYAFLIKHGLTEKEARSYTQLT